MADKLYLLFTLVLTTQLPLTLSRVFSYTRYYTADDSKHQGGRHRELGWHQQLQQVNCVPNDQEETALIYEAFNAPYVLMMEVFSPDYAPCGMLSQALAFYADGRCRPLPLTTEYMAATAVVNADLSLEVHIYNDSKCLYEDLNFYVLTGDVASACYTNYPENSFKFYASTTSTDGSMASSRTGPSWGGNSSSKANHVSGSTISDNAVATDPKSSKISVGTLAGIGAGCVVVVVLIVAIVVYRRKATEPSVSSPGHSPNKDVYVEDIFVGFSG